MSDNLVPVADPQLLKDAHTFLQECAKGQHADRLTFEDWSLDRQIALAQIGFQELTNRKAEVRQAAAWVVGALDVHEEESIARLGQLLRDRVAYVRMAAAWACRALGEDALAILPQLIAALHDRNEGVQFAVTSALQSFGDAAHAAVEPLIAMTAPSHSQRLREQALTTLGIIAPDVPAVRSVLLRELSSPLLNLRFAAAQGILDTQANPALIQQLLEDNLECEDPYLVCISAWAIGKLTGRDGRATPKLLEAMARLNWVPVLQSEVEGWDEFTIRDDLETALGLSLPETDDDDFAQFRTLFFRNAFHPTPQADPKWIEAVVNHPWYLKIQRRRFGHPANKAERVKRREWIKDAQNKFAERLLKNPTLGMTPIRFQLLPGFIKNHSRNIAWRIRQRFAASRSASPMQLETLADRRTTERSPEIAEIQEIIETQLSGDEREVARFRWIIDETIDRTAQALDLTPSQVKTRETKARKQLAAYLKRVDSPVAGGRRNAAPNRQ